MLKVFVTVQQHMAYLPGLFLNNPKYKKHKNVKLATGNYVYDILCIKIINDYCKCRAHKAC